MSLSAFSSGTWNFYLKQLRGIKAYLDEFSFFDNFKFTIFFIILFRYPIKINFIYKIKKKCFLKSDFFKKLKLKF